MEQTDKAKELIRELDSAIEPDTGYETLQENKAHHKKSVSFYDQATAFLKTLATVDHITKDDLQHLFAIVRELRFDLPPVLDVRVLNQKLPEEIKVSNLESLHLPKDVRIEKAESLEKALKEVSQTLSLVIQKQLQDVTLTGPRDARFPIAVRLSDGKQFYTALNQIIQTSASGSGSGSVDLTPLTTLLQQIADNTDTLEISADNVNLNTDELEAKVQEIIDALVTLQTTINSIDAKDFSTETTLLAIKDFIDETEPKLDLLIAKDYATETTLAAIGVVISSISTTLTSIDGKDFATETTLALIKAQTDNLDVLLSTRASEVTIAGILTQLDVALSTRGSEATLIQVRDNLDTVEASLLSILTNTTGLNLEATQQLIKTAVQSLDTDIDVLLSTRSSEATLIQVRDHLDTVEAKLQSIIDNTSDLEVNTDTLEALITAGNVLLTSINNNVDTIETKLQSIIDNTDTVETKLQSVIDELTRPATATLANVAASVTSVTLLASSAARKKFIIVNDGNATLYIKFGATASTTSFSIKLERGGIYESAIRDYTGIIDGIWDTASGSARVTSLS